MTSSYTHGLEHLSTFIRETSFGSRWSLAKRPTSDQGAKSKRRECSSLNGTSMSRPLLSSLGDYCGSEDRKIARSRGREKLLKKLHFLSMIVLWYTWIHRICESIHKTCTSENQAKSEPEVRREKLSLFLPETLLQLMLSGRRISFLKGMASWRHCLNGLAPKSVWAAQIELDTFP